jgi:4-hydroxy-4-methyl-2-oxoglutarate aldolase
MPALRFAQGITDGFLNVSGSNVSDACDRLSIKGAVQGILPLFPCAKIVGHAATLKLTKPGGAAKLSPTDGTFLAVEAGGPGAVFVIDSHDSPTVSCMGGIAGATAKHGGYAGCVADGIVRDVDEYKGYGLPVYARGINQQSVRGRSVVEGYAIPVQLGGVTVNPNDLIFADDNGVVVIPRDQADEVLRLALIIKATEDRVIAAVRSGERALDVMKKIDYDNLTKRTSQS